MTDGFGYVDDVSHWADWQREYRFGGFYIFPPAGIIEDVDDLRRQHDPHSHQICQAHVSLSEPVPRALTEEDLSEIRARLDGVGPFRLTYGDIHSTPPYPGVVYRIEPRDAVVRLRDIVHSVSAFSNTLLTRAGIPPHMTIAEFISLQDSVELARRLAGSVREGDWLCDEVEYAIPDQGFRFRRVLQLSIGDAADRFP